MAIKENKVKNSKQPGLYFETPIGHPKDRIIINESSDIPKEGQFISLNGYPFLVKPGHMVDVPRPVRLMLDTRIRTEIHQDEATGETYKRDIQRITYQLIKEDVDSQEVINAAEISESDGGDAGSVFN